MSLEPRTPPPFTPLTLLALVVAGLVSLGSVLLSWWLQLTPCPLCYYQRAFAFAALGVLLVGVVTGMGRTVALAALALPVATGGLGVAAYHVWLEASGALECPRGLFGVGTAPAQSLAGFAVLTLVLLSETSQDLRPGGGWASSVGTMVLGLALAGGCVLTAQPLPAGPAAAYQDAPKTCRRPYVPG